MGFLDNLLGSRDSQNSGSDAQRRPPPPVPASTESQAVERYRYLLRTAPPDSIEAAHAEAFSKLTAEQRAEVLRQISAGLPESERAGAQSSDAQGLARTATRAEVRQPGFLERTLGGRSAGGGMGMGMGMGGMFAGSLLGSVAGTVIGSAVASQLMGGLHGGESSASDETHEGGEETAEADSGDSGGDSDFGGDDF